MISKEEAAEIMKSKGYDAYVEDGIVMVWVDHPLTVREHKALEKVFKDIGHNYSWGWRVKHTDQ